MRNYLLLNNEKVNARRRDRYHENPFAVLEPQREYNAREEVKQRKREYNKAYQAQNAEQIKVQRAEYRESNKEKKKVADKEYNAKNADKIKAQKSAAYFAKRQDVIDRNRRWRHENPEKILAKNQRRRAAKANVRVENIKPSDIYKRDNGICGICGEHVDINVFTIDHIVPLSKGGDHIESNLQIAHRSCNSKKGPTLPHIFYAKSDRQQQISRGIS